MLEKSGTTSPVSVRRKAGQSIRDVSNLGIRIIDADWRLTRQPPDLRKEGASRMPIVLRPPLPNGNARRLSPATRNSNLSKMKSRSFGFDFGRSGFWEERSF